MDMWNCFGLGIAAIAIEIVQMKDKFQSIANSKRIVYLSQTDVLTGAKNRNTYEDRIQRSISRISGDTVVLYADVNGLHEMNNTKGHSAGDKMLKTVASALINRFGADNTYRMKNRQRSSSLSVMLWKSVCVRTVLRSTRSMQS
jgi:predicted signal transduction protein with EAL and GGDEF domain